MPFWHSKDIKSAINAGVALFYIFKLVWIGFLSKKWNKIQGKIHNSSPMPGSKQFPDPSSLRNFFIYCWKGLCVSFPDMCATLFSDKWFNSYRWFS